MKTKSANDVTRWLLNSNLERARKQIFSWSRLKTLSKDCLRKTFIRHLTFCCPWWFVRQITVKWSSYPFRCSFEGKAIFFHRKKVSLRVFVRLNPFITPRVFKLNPFDDVLLSRWTSGKCPSLHCFCYGKGYKRMPQSTPFSRDLRLVQVPFFPFLPLFFFCS